MLDKVFLDYIKTPYNHHFTSNDPVVDILVRNDTWTGAVNQPYTLNIQLDYIGEREDFSRMSEFTYTQKSELYKANKFCYMVSDALNVYANVDLFRFSCRGPGYEMGDEINKHGYHQNSYSWEMASFDKKLSDFECDHNTPREFVYSTWTHDGLKLQQSFNTSELCTYISNGEHNINSLWQHYEKEWLAKTNPEMVCRCPDLESSNILQTVINTWSNIANINFNFNSDNPQVLLSYGSVGAGSDPTTAYDDRITWNNHKTQTATLSIAFSDEVCGGEWSAQDYKELHHGFGHIMSLDHPGDSVMFNSSNRLTDSYEYNRIDSHTLSYNYNPFSLCATVLAGGIDSSFLKSCQFNGQELSPISPMPVDIKAMQHIYTKKCFDAARIFKFDDHGSADILGFAIPEQSIFTLWGGCRKDNVLDLSEVRADNIQIDLNPGLGHFNVVGKNVFLIAYDSEIANVVSPATDMIDIITAENGAHNLFINTVNSDITLSENSAANIIFGPNAQFACVQGLNLYCDHLYIDDGQQTILMGLDIVSPNL